MKALGIPSLGDREWRADSLLSHDSVSFFFQFTLIRFVDYVNGIVCIHLVIV
jgi:hypothetical protein